MYKGKRQKVLILAAACHPYKGSEPGVGFTWVKAISNHYDVDVICGEKEGNREAIENELKLDKELAKSVNFHFIVRDDFNSLEQSLIKVFYPYYYYRYKIWMKKAYKKALDLCSRNDYILSHQLNMIGYREPGYLWKLDIPFVWGPVGGNGNIPWSFLSCIDFMGVTKQLFRIPINYYQIRFNRRVGNAIRRSSSLITANSFNQKIIKKIYGVDSKIVLISPTVSPHQLSEVKKTKKNLVKFVFSGLLISRKNLPTALKALSKLESREWSLDVLGNGPLYEDWKKLAINLKINSNIKWHGQLNKNDAIKVMSSCDVLLFPSLFEGAPGVVSEALSLGLPVISFDKDGQRDIINENCGILVPVDNPNGAILNFKRSINKLLSDPLELERLSRGALQQAKKFTVTEQLEVIIEAYNKSIL